MPPMPREKIHSDPEGASALPDLQRLVGMEVDMMLLLGLIIGVLIGILLMSIFQINSDQ